MKKADLIRSIDITPEVIERFWAKVGRTDDPELCWLWHGAFGSNGYGVVKIEQKNFYVHRLSVVLDGRSLPSKKIVHHECGNRTCVNPGHLKIMTQFENNQSENKMLHKRPAIGIQLELPDNNDVVVA